MITHELNEEDGILVVSPQSPLQSSDFTRIAEQIDPFIEKKGRLNGLMILAETFPGWENFGALLSHLKFVRDHHRKIKKVAAVTDNKFLSIMPIVADYFVNAEVRHFSFGDRQAAVEWLRSPK